MTQNVIQVLGNGDSAHLFKDVPRQGKLLICNMPPFEVSDVYASCMVDFKMMKALTEGSLNLDAYQWVLGTRPKMWMERQHTFYMKYGSKVKEFYTVVPGYAENATNFNCGHMAVHYAANKLKADEVQLFGFDSIFDFNMNSITDFYLWSDRGSTNNFRLIHRWRPIWEGIFKEFPDVKFKLFHKHDECKIKTPDNVEVVVV